MQPGPLLFQNQAPQVYTIFLGLLAANFFMGLFGFSAIRLFVKVINIPKKYLMPIIFTMTLWVPLPTTTPSPTCSSWWASASWAIF